MDTQYNSCHVEPIQPEKLPAGTPTVALNLLVEGMGCHNCALRVRNALVSVDGVEGACVGLMPPIAWVRYDPRQVAQDDLIAAVAGAGADTRHEYLAVNLSSRSEA
jgi:copper chaperone CopZ